MSLSNKKSPQVSWTLLSILDDLNHIVVYLVSIRSQISSFYHLFSLEIIQSGLITIVIIITFQLEVTRVSSHTEEL